MAMAMGIGSCSPSFLRKKMGNGNGRGKLVICGSLADQYRTLRIQPGASEMDVRRAFRQLALQYHPDVCKGNNCGVQFHQINEAYDIVMSSLRATEEEDQWKQAVEWEVDEPMRGMCDSSWDMWEEWMGWEGAGIRDYSSHVNQYI